ncbi:hypothetical protein N6H14_22225 [Paenibacillus sp. CC-CFT747]|nr:hypothetical protein N6H14_22225 [Paenibacillus sp. CC-CFT747]
MFRYFDKNNATISTLEIHLDESRLAQWQKVTLRGKAPEGAVYAKLIAVTSRYNISSAYYDDFTVTKKDQQIPVVSASLTPAANENGWNNGDTVLNLAADHAWSLTYSAEGAQPAAKTTVKGSSLQLPITKEGVTTVTYSATNFSGLATDPQKMEVRIDRTAPTVQFTGKSDYTVSENVYIGCSAVDALSGLADNPCSAPLVQAPAYTFEPGEHTVSVTAKDKAGNTVTSDFTFRIAVTYDGVTELVRSFTSEDPGITEALTSKLQNAAAAEERGTPKPKPACLMPSPTR